MTPEDIEQLKQLKQLVDDGVLSPEDFEVQKNLILSSTSRSTEQPGLVNPTLSPTQKKMPSGLRMRLRVPPSPPRRRTRGSRPGA